MLSETDMLISGKQKSVTGSVRAAEEARNQKQLPYG